MFPVTSHQPNGTVFVLAISIVLGLVFAAGTASADLTSSAGEEPELLGTCVEIYGPPSPTVGVRPSDCVAFVRDLVGVSATPGT